MNSDSSFNKIIHQISNELSISHLSTRSVVQLLEDGNTVPFIARYRKEATGNLDELQIRNIQERHQYLIELEERKTAIITSIENQGKLTEELRNAILNAETKNEVEDLYLPFKPKRRTRATIAKEKGLEPLAIMILDQILSKNPKDVAATFINSEKGVLDEDSALSGARDIVAEKISENAVIRTLIREAFLNHGIVISKAITEKITGPTKFEQYYDFKEPVKTIPSHRYLAIRRGEKEEILDFRIELESLTWTEEIKEKVSANKKSPFYDQLSQAIEDAYKRLLLPSVETDIRIELKEASDRAAVDIFAENLRHLLLSSPLGAKKVIGIDPGIRTGCKCVSIDQTGKFLESLTIYPFQSEASKEQSAKQLLDFIKKFNPFAIAIGNGTAGRETEAFVKKVFSDFKVQDIIIISVSEAGASVYSASDVAREEFPELDVTIRGAISIARRLQDPLAELVKIDPKSIGVGQYQHDVYQQLLQDQLSQVVESCVNRVGVDLNTASASLLSYVSGIGPSLAQKIVKYRESKGNFNSRQQLREIPGFGLKTFEQAAGFLRVRGGDNILDSSAVHPERYDLVQQIAKDLGVNLDSLINNDVFINQINVKKYQNQSIGELTLKDIIEELKKPGRDPRSEFEAPGFREDIMTMKDLQIGMKLQGIVTNVTAFGAFVDIGVHQDGLIHLSELSEKFINHPSEVVKAGDKIQVQVLNIDIERKRISLTARIGNREIQSHPENKKIKADYNQKDLKQKKTTFNSNPFASL